MAIRKIIQIDEALCNGCGNCIVSCAEGALEIIDGKATVVRDSLCDGLGACMGDCPTGALKIIEREAPEFDEEEVRKHLASMVEPEPLACGCPSNVARELDPLPNTAVEPDKIAAPNTTRSSQLSNWPVQLRLVNPSAPYFKGAKLALISSCVPLVDPNTHDNFMTGYKTIMACPKLDDTSGYVEKLAGIFREGGVTEVRWVRMEVPCCGGMGMMLREAIARSGIDVKVEEIVISVEGKRIG